MRSVESPLPTSKQDLRPDSQQAGQFPKPSAEPQPIIRQSPGADPSADHVSKKSQSPNNRIASSNYEQAEN